MDVMVTSLNDSSIMISWMPPNKSNGVITTYNVMIFKLEGTEILSMNTTSASQTTFMGFDLGMLELYVNIILIVYVVFRCWNTIQH